MMLRRYTGGASDYDWTQTPYGADGYTPAEKDKYAAILDGMGSPADWQAYASSATYRGLDSKDQITLATLADQRKYVNLALAPMFRPQAPAAPAASGTPWLLLGGAALGALLLLKR